MQELQRVYFWHYGSDDLSYLLQHVYIFILDWYCRNIFKADLPIMYMTMLKILLLGLKNIITVSLTKNRYS